MADSRCCVAETSTTLKSNYPPIENKFKKSPAEFLSDTLWTPLSLTSSLPSPHQIPSPRLFRLHPFSLCPSLPPVIQLGLPGFLSFPSDCSHPDSGWFKVQSTPFVRGGWHQGRFSFISDSFFLMCICSWEHEKPVAEGFCHQSIFWVNQVVRPWSSGGHGLAVVPLNVVICLTATVHTPAVSPMSDCTLNQHILWSSELLSPYTLQMYIKFHRSFPFRRRIRTHTHTHFFFFLLSPGTVALDEG